MAETIPTKSKILKQSSDCFKDSQTQICKELVFQIEKFQLLVFDQKKIQMSVKFIGAANGNY